MYCHATLFRKSNFHIWEVTFTLLLYIFRVYLLINESKLGIVVIGMPSLKRCRTLQLSCQTTCFWMYFIDPNSDEKFKFIVHDFEFDDILLILELTEIKREEDKFRHDPEEEVWTPERLMKASVKIKSLLAIEERHRVLPKFSL